MIHCFSSFYFQSYATHCLDLLIRILGGKNMGKMNREKAKVIISFI